MKSKKKLVEEYIQKIISKLCYEYGASLEDARKAVEELDLLNRYKGNYDFVLYQNVSTWVNLIVNKRKVDKRKKEAERENLENKTTVRPQSYHLLDYTEQPTTKNTKYGDVVLYHNQIWLNTGNIVAPMSLNNYINIDKNGTILDKPLTKDYVDEKVEEALKENTMENYIVINGKKAELTEEQLKQLGIEVEKKRNNPFNNKLKCSDEYFTIGDVVYSDRYTCAYDENRISDASSFNDKEFAEQLRLHELLNRKLLKYAYDNEAEDCDWDGENEHYYICFNNVVTKRFIVAGGSFDKCQKIYFSKEKIAEQAIEDVIKPFIEEHPEFVW